MEDVGLRDRIAAKLEEEFTPYGLKVQTWATGVGISPVTKYDGLDRYFTEHEGEVPVALALGDSENDIPLFTYAKEHGGYAGQVGNGRDLDYQVDFKAEASAGAGVAEIIEHYRDMPDGYAF
jgi:hydroxymethylpyrimidine pyrophosphatase-like HAD family hydrolase